MMENKELVFVLREVLAAAKYCSTCVEDYSTPYILQIGASTVVVATDGRLLRVRGFPRCSAFGRTRRLTIDGLRQVKDFLKGLHDFQVYITDEGLEVVSTEGFLVCEWAASLADIKGVINHLRGRLANNQATFEGRAAREALRSLPRGRPVKVSVGETTIRFTSTPEAQVEIPARLNGEPFEFCAEGTQLGRVFAALPKGRVIILDGECPLFSAYDDGPYASLFLAPIRDWGREQICTRIYDTSCRLLYAGPEPTIKEALEAAVRAGVHLERVDLRWQDLTGARLAGVWLVRADLTGARLAGADLRGADLAHASLLSANIEDADLRGADLQHVYAVNAFANRARFDGANMEWAALDKARMIEASFRGCRLKGVTSTGADLSGAALEVGDQKEVSSQ